MKKFCLALLVFMLLAGCSGGKENNEKSKYVNDLTAGSPAIDFLYRDMDNLPFRLSEHKGQVVLLYFWRMKCEECKIELRALEALHEKFGNKGLVVVAVGADSMHSGSLYDVNKFLEKEGFSFVKIRDEDGFVSEAYRIMQAPEAYVIDKGGNIAHVQKGEADWSGPGMTEMIEKLL